MASLFVSHSSQDKMVTEHISRRLRDVGFAAPFVDFDPDHGISAGRNWERELYAQLRRADAVIFLASEASIASAWCFSEVSLARSLGKPVFPLRLQPGVSLPLLDEVQWVDYDDGAGVARLVAGLRSAGVDPADGFAWDPTRLPYPGLAAFASEDAAVFFGRERESARLVELLQSTLQRGPGRFIAVVGPSGSGKSSLLHAGLLPRLARLPKQWMIVPPMRPGREPTANLARCLAQAFELSGQPRTTDELVKALGDGDRGLVALVDELAERGRDGRSQPNALIVIDQAEELLTRSGPVEQRAFLKMIRGALGEVSPLWVVATVRSEFLSSAPDRAGLAEVVDDPLVIEPLSRARLGEVIVGPARRAGLEFAPGLVERMVEETAGGDALPLLAYTLRELCQRVGPDGEISVKAYDDLGGVVGALQRRADRLTGELNRRGASGVVVPTLVQLATVTGRDQPTRRRIRRSELGKREQVVIDAFVDAHLLTSDHTSTSEQDEAEATVEVAHEALLRQWAPLRNAIELRRDSLQKRTELERLAADWRQGESDDSYLLRGGRLAIFDDWARRQSKLGASEQRFLEASRALANRELESTQRSNRRLRALAGGLGLLLILSLVAGLAAVIATRRADEQSDVALKQTDVAQLQTSRRLAAEAARLVLESRPDAAALTGLQSISGGRQIPPPAGLLEALAKTTHASQALTGLTTEVADMRFSSDGRHLAIAGTDGTAQMWDLTARQPIGHSPPVRETITDVALSPDRRLIATVAQEKTVRFADVTTGNPDGQPLVSPAAVRRVAFSADGRLVVTGQADGTVQIWDTNTRLPRGPLLAAHVGAVTAMAFSPDGQLLATVGGDAAIRLWDAATGRPRGGPLSGHTDVVAELAFNPDGTLLASVSHDQTVRLWDIPTGQPRGQPLRGHSDRVETAVFSPDGKLLATAGADQAIWLWDVATGQPQGPPLTGHTATVNRLAFSPDGKILATGGNDRAVRLWDVAESYALSRSLNGHTAPVNDVAISNDGQILATAGDDQAVRLWNRDRSSYRPRGETLIGHRGAVTSVAFSPDMQLLASASTDQTAQLWDVATGQPRGLPLVGHKGAVRAVAFSPDGRLLATAGDDGTIRLWTPGLGSLPMVLTGHSGTVHAVVFSPDGQMLISAGADKTVRIWDVATGLPRGRALANLAAVRAAVISRDGGLLATAADDQTVTIWRLADLSRAPKPEQSAKGKTGTPQQASIERSSPPTTEMYETADPPRPVEPEVPSGPTEGPTTKPRSKSTSGSTADVQPPLPVSKDILDVDSGQINDLAFSSDNSRLAIAGTNKNVQLWDIGTVRPVGSMLTDRTTTIRAVAFTPDGTQLVGAGEDATVRLWDPRFTSWKESVCQLVDRNLTAAEWQEVAEGLPYQRTCPNLPSGEGAPPAAAPAVYAR